MHKSEIMKCERHEKNFKQKRVLGENRLFILLLLFCFVNHDIFYMEIMKCHYDDSAVGLYCNCRA